MKRKRNGGVIYFDACVYVAHLRKEPTYSKAALEAIEEVWTENERGGNSIVTSALTVTEVTEVLKIYGLHAELDEFKARFTDGLHELIDVDPVIAEKAALYRVHYQKHPLQVPNKPEPYTNLTTPDAIHCATAVLYEANELWTFDGLKMKNDKHRSIKLLWLGNRVANDEIIIMEPSVIQPRLL